MVSDRTSAPPRPLRVVALIGIDGSGKTTQARRLAAELTAAGHRATYHQNAGGRRWFGRLAARFGRQDAEELLGRRTMLIVESVLRWLAIARALLHRARTGDIAVMDRYAACQYASIRARGRHARRGEWLARAAYRFLPRPDVTFLLRVEPAIAHQRVEMRGYDHETVADLTAADAAYRSLPEYAEVVEIDANPDPEIVNAAIHAHLAARLPVHPRGLLPARTPAARPARSVPTADSSVLGGAGVVLSGALAAEELVRSVS
jgi:dTMP kinase